MPLDDPEFDYIQELVAERSGVFLAEERRSLISSRVGAVTSALGFASTDLLIEHLRASHYSRLHRSVIEELIEEDTHFFRDFPAFKFMRHTAIPHLLKSKRENREINVWCAGCSSGQEAYSIAIMVKEAIPSLSDWTVKIIGTDISTTLLERAEEGKYSQHEVNRGLPASLLLRNFDKMGIHWMVKKEHRDRVEFRHLNLIEPWAGLPMLDIIFLRNVLFYFQPEALRRVTRQLAGHMHEDTFLFLGQEEDNPDPELIKLRGEQSTGCYQLLSEAERRATIALDPVPEPVVEETKEAAPAPEEAAPASEQAVLEETVTDIPSPVAAPEPESSTKTLAIFQAQVIGAIVEQIVKNLPQDAYLNLSLCDAPPDGTIMKILDTGLSALSKVEMQVDESTED